MPLAILAAAVAAPALYVSDAYGVSFKPPPNAYICSTPDGLRPPDRAGPGVSLFLEPPADCADVARIPADAGLLGGAPRIEVQPGFATTSTNPPPACSGRAIVREAWILGLVRPICRSQSGPAVRYSIEAAIERQRPGLSVAVRLVASGEPTEDQFMDMLYVVASLELCGASAPETRPCPRGSRF